jgi:hypothetical protein
MPTIIIREAGGAKLETHRPSVGRSQIKQQTVLILGAGASRPYRYPLGQELRDILYKPTPQLQDLLHDLGYIAGDIEKFCVALKRFEAGSIDEFLESYPEHSELGKLGIAYELAKHETLEPQPQIPEHEHWYKWLWRDALGRQATLANEALSIITFNYDVSLEAYLQSKLVVELRISQSEAVERVTALRHVHVHGDIGPIEPLAPGGRKFGPITDAPTLKRAGQGISITYESLAEGKQDQMEKVLRQADRVAIFGFGYGADNLDKLNLKETLKSSAHIRGVYHQMDSPEARLRELVPHVASITIQPLYDGGRTMIRAAQWLLLDD